MIISWNVDAGWTDYDKWDELLFEFDRQVSFLGAAKTLAPELVTNTTLRQRWVTKVSGALVLVFSMT